MPTNGASVSSQMGTRKKKSSGVYQLQISRCIMKSSHSLSLGCWCGLAISLYTIRRLCDFIVLQKAVNCCIIIIKCKGGVKIMYPVQVMISYFTTSFTVIMHIGREVTAKQYTGGGLQDSKGTYIKKQAQEWVRLVSYRYKEGQCRHILSFLACLHSFVISNYWLPPVCHSVWNDRSMTMFV